MKHISLIFFVIVTFGNRLKEARGEAKVEVLSSDVIASRLKQVLTRCGVRPSMMIACVFIVIISLPALGR